AVSGQRSAVSGLKSRYKNIHFFLENTASLTPRCFYFHSRGQVPVMHFNHPNYHPIQNHNPKNQSRNLESFTQESFSILTYTTNHSIRRRKK
ncbi:MAG: hypothetical protein IJR49_03800, partial [Treponema sp.]|nr:hypothetical protein [Treponema sp.]